MTAPYDDPAISRVCFSPRGGPTLSRTENMWPVDLPGPDGGVLGAYWSGSLQHAPAILLLPGIADVVGDLVRTWPLWAREAGANLLMLDWPGYGNSDGAATLSAARAAARTAMGYLLERPLEEVPAVLVLGRSIGALFALEVVARHPVDRVCGLVLESGIADLARWLDEQPVEWDALAAPRDQLLEAVRRDFDEHRWASEVRVPSLVMHPSIGGISGMWHGDMLAEWLGAELVWLKRGEHDNVPELNAHEYRAALGAFVRQVAPTLDEAS